MNYKLLKCAKLFGGNCKFVSKTKSKQETMHILMGHVNTEHKKIMEQLSKEELNKKMEEAIETEDN